MLTLLMKSGVWLLVTLVSILVEWVGDAALTFRVQ